MRGPKVISSRMHGVMDYATSAAVAAAPHVMNFPPAAKRAAVALAAGYTGLSAVADYPLSARRMVPFKAHGAAELAISAALPALPWLLGFARHKPARNFFIGLAAMSVVIAALTNWDDED